METEVIQRRRWPIQSWDGGSGKSDFIHDGDSGLDGDGPAGDGAGDGVWGSGATCVTGEAGGAVTFSAVYGGPQRR